MEINPDLCYKLLVDDRRRTIIEILETGEPPVALADLARQVAISEIERRNHYESVSTQTQQVYRSLYHVHIPKLADADIVSYDAERRTVTDGPYYATLQSIMSDHRGQLAGAQS